MATADGRCDFKPATFKRRAVGPRDVLIGMRYCGVCHSDLVRVGRSGPWGRGAHVARRCP